MDIGACDGTVEGEGCPWKLAAVNQPKEAHHMADLAQMKHLADRSPPPPPSAFMLNGTVCLSVYVCCYSTSVLSFTSNYLSLTLRLSNIDLWSCFIQQVLAALLLFCKLL